MVAGTEPAGGALHPSAQAVDHDRLAGLGQLLKQLAQILEGGNEDAVGLAEPQRAKRAEQQVEALAHLGLGGPDHSAGTSVRQPIEDDRSDGVQAHL